MAISPIRKRQLAEALRDAVGARRLEMLGALSSELHVMPLRDGHREELLAACNSNEIELGEAGFVIGIRTYLSHSPTDPLRDITEGLSYDPADDSFKGLTLNLSAIAKELGIGVRVKETQL